MKPLIISRAKIYLFLAILGVISLAVISGWRNGGIDRDNYLMMHFYVLSSDNIAEKFFFAKDAAFLIFSILIGYFSDDARWVFLLICTISLITKFFAIKKISPQHLLQFITVYAIFLSPGLEFAAMRGALAIGFLILTLAYCEKWRLFAAFSFLAIASHMTILPAVLLTYRPINDWLARHKFGYLAIAILTSLLASKLIELFPHGMDYEENRGTLRAYALPIATLIFSTLILYRFEMAAKTKETDVLFHFIKISKPVIYGLISIAFGLSNMIVAGSTRYLEIAWCLLLLPALVLYRRSFCNLIGLMIFIAFLSYFNIARFTWLAVIAPSLFRAI